MSVFGTSLKMANLHQPKHVPLNISKTLFNKQSNSVTKVGGNWPVTNSELSNKYRKFFQKFVNTINLENL
jgi:hypothetical protein